MGEQSLTIDFLVPDEIVNPRTNALAEKTILSMYMNNRSAELLVQAKLDEAYWVARDPNYHEFHFWLALAHFLLGELQQANEQLTIAQENSTTQHDHDLYAAKLNRLKSHQTQQ